MIRNLRIGLVFTVVLLMAVSLITDVPPWELWTLFP